MNNVLDKETNDIEVIEEAMEEVHDEENIRKMLSITENRQFENRQFRLPPCNEDKIASSLVVLHAVSPEVLAASPTYEFIDDVCIKQSIELDKLEAHLKMCQPPSSKDLYMQLIKGIVIQRKIYLLASNSFQENF